MKTKLKAALALALTLSAVTTTLLANSNSNIVISGDRNVVIVNGNMVSGGTTYEAEGDIKSETRKLPEFNKMLISGAVNVEWHASTETRIELKAGENVLKNLKSVVTKDTLALTLSGNQILSQIPTAVVYSPALEFVTLSGSGTFKSNEIAGEHFNMNLNGSGDIIVSGITQYSAIKVTGSGDVDARRLDVEGLSVHLVGSGDVQARSSEQVEVTQVGSGTVTITGKPEKRKVEKVGSGDVAFN